MRWMMMMLLLAACATLAPPVPAGAQLQGSYRLAEVNGQALPAEVDEGGVTVLSGALVLGADGRYALEMEVDTEDEGRVARKVVGTYEVDGDLLFLEPDEDQEAEPVDFTYVLEDGRLTLAEEDAEVTVTFVRR